MTPPADPPPHAAPPGRPYAPWAASWTPILLLVLGFAAVRLVYLAWFCPYTLIEDEAHYWEWSRHLDWSYYSKGPGIAWLIAASVRMLGDSEFAVRLPAALCSAAAALSLAGLARDATGDRRAGFFTAAIFQLVPMFQSTSLLMTIDMPYAACWSFAAWMLWRASSSGALLPLLASGLAVAVGVAFKHTMLLFLPGVLVFSLALRRGRPDDAGPGLRLSIPRVLAVAACSLLGLVPNLIWNAQRDWPTVRHLLGHLGVAGGDVKTTQGSGAWHYDPTWTLEFVGSQLALGGPMLVLAWLGARRWSDRPIARAFLLALALPILLFYLAVSFLAEPEGNWALAGYTTLVPLAALAVVRGMDDFLARTRAWQALPEPRPKHGLLRRSPETLSQIAWHATLAIGLLAGLAALRLDWLATLPGPVGRAIPLSRLVGADRMAKHAAALLGDLRARTPGKEPFVVSQFYGRASQMSFYLPGRPFVYCSGSRMGGRKSQYDLWPHADLANPDLAGRPALLLGDQTQDWSWGFPKVEPLGALDGDRKRNRVAFFGFEYTPPAPSR